MSSQIDTKATERGKVPCNYCGKMLMAKGLASHMTHIHPELKTEPPSPQDIKPRKLFTGDYRPPQDIRGMLVASRPTTVLQPAPLAPRKQDIPTEEPDEQSDVDQLERRRDYNCCTILYEMFSFMGLNTFRIVLTLFALRSIGFLPQCLQDTFDLTLGRVILNNEVGLSSIAAARDWSSSDCVDPSGETLADFQALAATICYGKDTPSEPIVKSQKSFCEEYYNPSSGFCYRLIAQYTHVQATDQDDLSDF